MLFRSGWVCAKAGGLRTDSNKRKITLRIKSSSGRSNRSRQSIDGILGRRKAQAESKDLVGCRPGGIRASSGPAMTSPVNVAMRRQVERKARPRTNEKKEPQIPSASLGAGTSTARRPDPHNHPNDRKGGARWGPRKEAGRKFFAGAALRRKSFTTETRRARSFTFFRGFSVISVPPWLSFISMGGPQTHAIRRMTSLKGSRKIRHGIG